MDHLDVGAPELLKVRAPGAFHQFLPVAVGLLRPFGKRKLREHPPSGHHGRLPEEPLVAVIETVILDRDGSGALSHNGDVVRVAAELPDIVLHPADRLELVVQSEVPVAVIFSPDLLMAEIAQDAYPVVDEDGDHSPFRKFIAAERFFGVGSGVETSSVEEEDDRAVLRLCRRIDVQVQAVLVIVKLDPLPELPVIEQALGISEVGIALSVLGTGVPHFRRVEYFPVAADPLTVFKALRPGVRDPQEFAGTLLHVPQERSHGRFQHDFAHKRYLSFRYPILLPDTPFPSRCRPHRNTLCRQADPGFRRHRFPSRRDIPGTRMARRSRGRTPHTA